MSLQKPFFFTASILIAVCVFVWFRGGDSDFDEVAFANLSSDVLLEAGTVNVSDGVTLNAVFAGPKDGVPIILIHGFPAFWFIWRDHISILAEAGYRVVAPDLRGYNRSSKPLGGDEYTISKYAQDIVGIMDSQGWADVHLAGHDIGAQIAWHLVFEQPERVRSAVIFSVPHPLAKAAEGAPQPNTFHRGFFDLPILPELASRAGGLSLVANKLRTTSKLGTFSDETLEVYKASWDRNHAFTTMLGYYRAAQVLPPSMPANGATEVPVMYYFGLNDDVIALSQANDTATFLGDDRVVVSQDAGHWLIAEFPAKTATDIVSFTSRWNDQGD